jgi:sigma-B regulation protein RsbU (phosphoserine phosphatase)
MQMRHPPGTPSGRLWMNAVEQTAESVVITDRQGVIRYINPGFIRTTGFSAEEALGQTPRILKSGKHPPEFYKALWATILSGRTYSGLIENRKKSGELYVSQQSICPIRDKRGRITHFVSVLRDVTELLLSKKREGQMELAREIQERFYGAAVAVPGYDIAGTTVQAQDVGGDYFDFIPMADGALGVVVADVTGHGVGAALVMAETRAYLRTLSSQTADLGEILTHINRVLADDLPDNQFVTLLLARLDPRTRTVAYANAGHVPGFLLDGTGEVRTTLGSLGPPLGIFGEQAYSHSGPIALEDGDHLLLLTDGVLETMDASEEQFGLDRAVQCISSQLGRSAAEMVEGLHDAVCAFQDRALQDDVTAVILKVLPR